jgi:hypothetical protein
MTDQTEIETPEKAVEEDLYHKPAKLIHISFWANTVSWVVLALTVLFVGVNIYYIWIGGGIRSFNFMAVLNLLYTLAIGVFYFLTLQVISEGVYILMDILDGVRESARKA